MRNLIRVSIAVVLLSVTLMVTNSLTSAQSPFDGSRIPGYPDVIGEYLQIPGANAPGTPAVLNTAAFLRVRTALDGNDPKPANAVIVAQPGYSSMPAHWLYLAAQLVHKASQRKCDGEPCRIEVWVVDRRGSNLEDTIGLQQARAQYDPMVALDYYFGRSVLSVDPKRPGKFPLAATQTLVGRPDAKWKPLQQADLPFMTDWGYETYAGDIDAMIALLGKQYAPKNIFLAGHSQGGGFTADYAGRRLPDGTRGYQNLAGLIFLDSAPIIGATTSPSPADLTKYFDTVNALRAGKVPVYTDATGSIGALAGPAPSARSSIISLFYTFTPDAESIFQPVLGYGTTPLSPAGDAFLASIRLTYRAFAGMTFDVDPLPLSIPGAFQVPALNRLAEGLGRLDFAPVPGTEARCDRSNPKIPETVCVPTPEQLDPNKVYGWLDGGGGGPVSTKVGKAKMWQDANAYAPALTNVKPMTVTFAVSGQKTIDASDLNAKTWYPSERYESDMAFLATYTIVNIQEQGVSIDMDKSTIAGIPVYVAHRTDNTALVNPDPGVTDITEITNKGLYQSDKAKAITPFDPTINTKFYFHTDFVSADDSLAGSVMPGQPGASVVADTLIDWILARSQGRTPVLSPMTLGVVNKR